MNITRLISLAALALAGVANAATVSLVPGSEFVDEGAVFSIDLVLDARDVDGDHPGAMNGIVTIEYDPTLVAFNGFDYIGPAGANDGVIVVPDSGVERVALDFTGALDDASIGTYSFTALADEGTEISFSFVALLSGGFANESPTNRPFEPDFIDASVSVVPLPASAWLMLSALGFAASSMRRRA